VLYLSNLPLWLVFTISTAISVLVAIIIKVFVAPWSRRRILTSKTAFILTFETLFAKFSFLDQLSVDKITPEPVQSATVPAISTGKIIAIYLLSSNIIADYIEPKVLPIHTVSLVIGKCNNKRVLFINYKHI
jgi:hypothetical protein